ncbi:MAG: 3'-5' exonuclease, partial [Pseudomonadota bacterium]
GINAPLFASSVLVQLPSGMVTVLGQAEPDSEVELYQVDALGNLLEPIALIPVVVGDKKQSIYSFQGADARLFDTERNRMEEVAASHPYREESLFLSFRSSPSVLDTVDALFEGEAGHGLYGKTRDTHAPAKPELPGAVELWPLVRRPEKEEADLWTLPVDASGATHPHRRLSQEIARDIEDFMSHGTVVDKDGHPRRLRYGDIMILCQRRTGIFPEIVRTLALRKIPNGGTDRVKLKDDVAVKDLLAALRFATSHSDDLSLAEVLKSPFGGFTDEDLYTLAYDRGSSRLWARLRDAQNDTSFGEQCTDIVARLEAAEEAGRRLGAFAYLSSLLEEGQPNGRYLLRQRLGDASDDALDELMSEALAFDSQNPRTLNGFLAHLEGLSTDIKKEFGEESDVVRVMTVHGAKGLEAPVVYLADAGYLSRPRYDGIPLLDQGEEDGLFIRAPSGLKHPVIEEGKAYLRDREMQEYRRKLYVAATRAEQRLVICGTESGRMSGKYDTPDDAAMDKPAVEASWYGLAMQAYDRVASRVATKPCPWREDMDIRIIAGGKVPSSGKVDAVVTSGEQVTTPPPWLFTSAEREASPTVYFPSSYDEEDEGPVLPPRGVGDEPSPRQRGLAIHQLLELLPSLPADQWAKAADRLLARQAAEQAEAVRDRWRDEALAVLRDPAFGEVFGPEGQPEVALRGRLGDRVYAGQVDRLLVKPDEILVVDYKTMRPPPHDPAAVPPGILRQMAIYRSLLAKRFPDRPVQAAILWTYSPRLMPLPEELLVEAIETIAS